MVIGWAAHLAVYPIFTVYGWCLVASADAFDAYLLASCEHWELRHAELATAEHSTV